MIRTTAAAAGCVPVPRARPRPLALPRRATGAAKRLPRRR
jgi:hypothetical protein